ncbi:MAG: NAD(P)/FAD-dependent oxidoreductase [Deferribacteres bacterium]|nr:NAD(P)/FAD-dependent oxidoreductase [Deferribacteres bacterium]
MKETINIIGAGPAGLTAAIVLRRHGFPRVYEMSSHVGHRLSGDFQGFENWSSERDITEVLKETGIEINFLYVPCYGGTLFAPEMKPAEISSDRPIFYLVRRGPMPETLDTGLKEQALSLGVEILFNHRLDPGSLGGKAIVGTGPKKADAVIVGITFNTDSKDTVGVIFDNDIAPDGYAYVMVHQGRGTMAAVLYRDFRRGNECFGKMLDFFRDNMDIVRDEKRFGGYGNIFLRDTQIQGDSLYVGEAAGFQDALWGFGMRYAVLSGRLAAESLINGSNYDMLWKRELKPMIETSLVNRYLYAGFGHTGYRHLTRQFLKGRPCDYLRKHYSPSFLKRLLLPLATRHHERQGMRLEKFYGLFSKDRR